MLTAVLATPAFAAGDTGPKVADFKLPNGLELVVIPDHRAPVVTHMVWYKVGAADETAGKSGLAHFLEHLMFKGTAKNPAGAFSQVVAHHRRPGERVHLERLHRLFPARAERATCNTVMEFEADRMTGLRAHRRGGAARARTSFSRSRTSASTTIRARGSSEQIEAALYLNHPYGRPVIGWRHEMEQLNRDDAIALLPALLRPEQRDRGGRRRRRRRKQALKLAEDTYGKVARARRSAPRVRPQEPPQIAARSLTLADPRVEQPILQRDYLVPSFHTAKPGQSEALEVLAHILGTRLEQPALSARWSSNKKHRGRRRRLVRELGARRFAVRRLRLAARRRHACRSSKRDRRRHRRRSPTRASPAEELERTKTRLIADAVYARTTRPAWRAGTAAR